MAHGIDALEQTLANEHDGTRTWIVRSSSPEELLRRVTLIFAEHIHDDDEIHIAYNAMQSGWRDNPPNAEHASSFTELFFEYSALIVTRPKANRTRRELVNAIWALVEKLEGA